MNLSDYTIEELSQLEKLLQVSNNVGNKIDKLCTLEIHNQKDSEEYKHTLLELTRAINIENETYKTINLDYQHYYKFARLLSTQIHTGIFDTKPTNSFKNYNNRIIKRVINILISIMQQDQSFHESIIPDEILDTLSRLNKSITKKDFIKGISHNIKIQSTLDSDINSIFLSILEESINQRNNQQYKEELIKAKYCIATSNKDLEIFLLENKFSIPNHIYTNSKIINELLLEGELSYDIIRFSELKIRVQIEINKLLNTEDNEYNNKSTHINSIISSCYIRALFSLMTGNEINDFNAEFHEQINNFEYLKQQHNNRISESIIMNCFKHFNQDKEKVRILSTKSNI